MRLYLLALLLALPMTPEVSAAEGVCRVVHFDLRPSDDLQLVIWIEDAEGNFIDTAFITRKTGSYGLGNRPGLMEFNSGPDWCYGRRETTFPVWAHRHGLSWPQMIFQDEDDRDLSHSITESSLERTYCRPIEPTEDLWDAETCATTVFTDKGKFGPETSLYPPRNDPDYDQTRDNADVQSMIASNPFDAVSKPTPLGGAGYKSVWSIPESLADGQYVAWIEVSKEFDQNATYDYPAPVGIPWSTYGEPYRGQPSVVYQVPFEIGGGDTPAFALDYLGYGDPEGVDGELRAPDSSITSGVAGSGAGRLLITSAGDEMYRFKVQASSSDDALAPGAVAELTSLLTGPDAITLQFRATGDDGEEGTVNSYEVRYLAGGKPLTEANWSKGTLASAQILPAEAGELQEATVTGLLPNTNYSIGVRAIDECLNQGPVASLSELTPRPEPGTVDACFVATAAYGSLMANEVVALRSFRDRFLRSHATGEILVESYYTFGPALAKLMQGSPLLRRTARAALAPAVERATALVAPR